LRATYHVQTFDQSRSRSSVVSEHKAHCGPTTNDITGFRLFATRCLVR
jgi:hypothetical protein